MANIYRKTALDKLSSPDQLDKAITIISPSFWIAALGGGLILAVALIWSILGRLPVNVSTSGIFMGQEGLGTVVSEGSGVVTDVYVSEGEYVKAGQEIAQLDVKVTEEEINALKERREMVENVTFDSDDDILSADNKALIDIKAQRVISDNSLTTDRALLRQKEQELEAQVKKTQAAKSKYDSAKSSYLDSMGTSGTADEQMALQDAQAALSAAQQSLTQAESALDSAQKQADQLEEQQTAFTDAAAAAQEAYTQAQTDMADAQTAMTESQTAQATAQAQLDAANVASMQAQNDLNAAYAQQAAAQTEEEIAAAQAAVEAAEAASQQAEQDAADAQAALEGAAEAYNTSIYNYENASNTAVTAQTELNTCNENLAQIAQQLKEAQDLARSAYDTTKSVSAQVNQAQRDYDRAERNYVNAMNSVTAQQGASNQAGTIYSAAAQDYNTELATQRSLESAILQLAAQVDADIANLESQNAALKMQFDSTKAAALHQIDQEITQKQTSADTATITAKNDGYVASLNIRAGNAVQAGTTVCRIISDDDNEQVVICYAPVTEGRKIAPGMKAVVYPSTVNRQEYGHIDGEVVEVSDYVSSSEEMANQLGDASLVQAFQQNGPVVRITCALEKDENTASGYKWSSKKGSSVTLADGTMVSVDVVVEEKKPISMLIPFLKEKLSVKRDTGSQG